MEPCPYNHRETCLSGVSAFAPQRRFGGQASMACRDVARVASEVGVVPNNLKEQCFYRASGRGQLNILQTVVPSSTFSQWLEEVYGQAARLISTSKLNASLRFHTWPINLVVYQEPLEVLRPGRSHLVEGFTLRCIQRFSLPDVATRRCRWRDNRYTRGPSNPVLSY